MHVSKTINDIHIMIKILYAYQEPQASSILQSELKGYEHSLHHQININIETNISKTIGHIQTMMKKPNLNQTPPASSKFPIST